MATLAGIFQGSASIAERIHKHDWPSSGTLYESIAPSYRSLNRNSIGGLNEDLKLVITLLCNRFHQRGIRSLSHSEIGHEMLVKGALQLEEKDSVSRTKTFAGRGYDFLTHFRVLESAREWLSDLVGDHEFVTAIGIDAGVVKNVVKAAASEINARPPRNESVFNIGILTFPDKDHPYFLWSTLELWPLHRGPVSGLIVSGLTGRFNQRKYIPATSFIYGFPDQAREQWSAEAVALFAEV